MQARISFTYGILKLLFAGIRVDEWAHSQGRCLAYAQTRLDRVEGSRALA
jgi:hypothetical protein